MELQINLNLVVSVILLYIIPVRQQLIPNKMNKTPKPNIFSYMTVNLVSDMTNLNLAVI